MHLHLSNILMKQLADGLKHLFVNTKDAIKCLRSGTTCLTILEFIPMKDLIVVQLRTALCFLPNILMLISTFILIEIHSSLNAAIVISNLLIRSSGSIFKPFIRKRSSKILKTTFLIRIEL